METNPAPSPWAPYPCAPYIRRLIRGLNTHQLLRRVPKETWIVKRSFVKFKVWRKEQGISHGMYAGQSLKLHVPFLQKHPLDRGTDTNDKSRYTAVVYEFMCNFEMMQHFTSLTNSGRAAMRKVSKGNEDIMHTLAVAQLYCTSTRHLPKESENEDPGA